MQNNYLIYETDTCKYLIDLNDILSEKYDKEDEFIFIEDLKHYCKIIMKESKIINQNLFLRNCIKKALMWGRLNKYQYGGLSVLNNKIIEKTIDVLIEEQEILTNG